MFSSSFRYFVFISLIYSTWVQHFENLKFVEQKSIFLASLARENQNRHGGNGPKIYKKNINKMIKPKNLNYIANRKISIKVLNLSRTSGSLKVSNWDILELWNFEIRYFLLLNSLGLSKPELKNQILTVLLVVGVKFLSNETCI